MYAEEDWLQYRALQDTVDRNKGLDLQKSILKSREWNER